MSVCGHKWAAPRAHQSDEARRDYRIIVDYNRLRGLPHPDTQECVLDKGHTGDHRSAYKVIARNAAAPSGEQTEENET